MNSKLHSGFFAVLLSVLVLSAVSCSKGTPSNDSLYTPTTADVTSTATLAELQQGRALYVANCGSCHGFYSPDSYNSAQWKSLMASMGPKAKLTSADQLLITKYVTKGN
jgi:mono/diheme cytochrome c family protein